MTSAQHRQPHRPRRRSWIVIGVTLAAGVTAFAVAGVLYAVRPHGQPVAAVAPTQAATPAGPTREQAARAACHRAVEDHLKAPATARYSGEISSPDAGGFEIVGKVDSENALGVPLRSSWSCNAQESGGHWTTHVYVG